MSFLTRSHKTLLRLWFSVPLIGDTCYQIIVCRHTVTLEGRKVQGQPSITRFKRGRTTMVQNLQLMVDVLPNQLCFIILCLILVFDFKYHMPSLFSMNFNLEAKSNKAEKSFRKKNDDVCWVGKMFGMLFRFIGSLCFIFTKTKPKTSFV